jgi:deoxycytidine triphosphate deaminase
MTKTAIINPLEVLERKVVYTIDSAPAIFTTGPESQIQQVGIDLRLAKAYRVHGPVEFYTSKKSVKPELTELQLTENCYLFKAGHQYSIDFLEDVNVPEDMAGIVWHRSTFNRFSGNLMSGWFDPGFKSQGGCGAVFRPSLDTVVELGFRMAQVVFYSASSASLYSGQYQNT